MLKFKKSLPLQGGSFYVKSFCWERHAAIWTLIQYVKRVLRWEHEQLFD
ncbi:YodT [Bacillus sp. JS]|nr:YodT [Bacillus sp. JS]